MTLHDLADETVTGRFVFQLLSTDPNKDKQQRPQLSKLNPNHFSKSHFQTGNPRDFEKYSLWAPLI